MEVVLVVIKETGTQFAPEMDAGIDAGVTLVIKIPVPPGVAPKALLSFVLVPFKPQLTLPAVNRPEVKTNPPPPPPPGP